MRTDATLLLATLTVLLGTFAARPMRSEDVVISELLASNRTNLTDNHSEFSDWIELFNVGESPCSLDGWHLTDDPRERFKWRFPDVTLDPREYLLVFCSGKDIADPAEPLHSNFGLSGSGEYLALVRPDGEVTWQYAPFYPPQLSDVSYGLVQEFSEELLVAPGAPGLSFIPADGDLGLDWTDVNFDDSSWIKGPGGFGFDQKNRPTYAELIGTDLGEVMRRKNSSAYVRVPFEVSDVDSIDLLTLRMKYDDGFVATLNGVEVTRRLAPEAVEWNSKSTAIRRTTDALEFENFDLTPFKDLLLPGPNVLALHGLNSSVGNSAFFVLPELSATRAGSTDTGRRQFFPVPTPGAPNVGGLDSVTRPPVFSQKSGAYVNVLDVEISAPVAAVDIRYTLDGSTPNEESSLYSSPIRVDVTTQIKARAFEPGLLPSATAAESFLILNRDLENFTSNLPLVVIDTFGKRLPRTEADLSLEPCHVHVVDRASNGRSSLLGLSDFSGRGGTKVRGSSTATRQKASLSLEIRDNEDADQAVSLLGMPADSDWVLYGPYSPDRALVRNALVYDLSNQIGQYAVRTQFVELFLNEDGGQLRGPVPSAPDYFGVYVFMEKIKRGPHRVDVEPLTRADNEMPDVSGGWMFKIDRPDPFDNGFFVNGQPFRYVEPKEADVTSEQADWLRSYVEDFFGALKGPDFDDPDLGYLPYIDVDTFVDNHILNEFPKNPDAYSFSTYLHKRRGGPLRMGPVWDFNLAIGVDRAVNPKGWSLRRNSVWWGRLFEDLEFERRYIERWHDLRQHEFTLENLHATTDAMADELLEAQSRNFKRWSDLGVGTVRWQQEVDALKQWYSERVAWMDCELRSRPVLDRPGGQVITPVELRILNANDVGELFFTINGPDPMMENGEVAPEALQVTGPIEITENTRITARVRIDECFATGNGWTKPTEAIYFSSLPTLTITEIMYRPVEKSSLEYVELFNFGSEAVSLGGITLAEGVEFDFNQGSIDKLAAGEYLVVVRDQEAFSMQYDVTDVKIAGEYTGILNDRGEILALLGPVGESLFRVHYSSAWFSETNGKGHSLVLVDPEVPDDQRDDVASWRASAERHGSPGREDRKAVGDQIPGDTNQDGQLDVSDALALVVTLFSGGMPLPCGDGSVLAVSNRTLLDSNGDLAIDSSDVVHNLIYLFLEGEPPAQGINCVAIPDCPEVCTN